MLYFFFLLSRLFETGSVGLAETHQFSFYALFTALFEAIFFLYLGARYSVQLSLQM